MAKFNSFEPLLRKWLRKVQPSQILEFGPGKSTAIMVEECPAAKIYSLETDLEWYKKYYDIFAENPKVVIVHVSPALLADLPRSWKKMFDLIFVDGLCDKRVACLRTASQLLSSDGVVLLHDSERAKYRLGTELFERVEEADGTLVMKRKDRDG